MNTSTIGATAPAVAISNGRITTTSNTIAEVFGKNHRDVLRAIDNLDCSPEFTERNFALSEYLDSTGRALRRFDITKDGFVFLAMGFRGKEAARWKEKYIDAFNRMEAELRGSVPALPYTKNPGDTLTVEQADILRGMVKTAADLLPKDKAGVFSVQAWSRLKSHFKVGYRQIPQAEFGEAVSILARHISELTAAPLPAPDVRRLLLDGQSTPVVPLPADVQSAIDRRAWAMAHEAYELCREHLARRVAYHCEAGQPCTVDSRQALEVIGQGGLGQALAHAHYTHLGQAADAAQRAMKLAAKLNDDLRRMLAIQA